VTRPIVGPVVGAELLDRLSADPSVHLVVADVRWYLDGRDGRAAFAERHIPGAVWVDLDAHLAAHGAPATEGRHPLPDPAAFAASMASLGIGDDTVVVAYDDTGGLSAGRLVVMLRMLGRAAALLDGGLGAWVATGRATADGAAHSERPLGDPAVVFTPTPWPADRLASVDEAARQGAEGRPLLDARPFERFTGEVSSIDPRPGHIPGARSAPWSAVLGDGARFRPVDELVAHYSGLGVQAGTDVIASCGSGVSACVNVLAMEHAGFAPPRLFVASWSGWASDPARPAETGPGR
jgi:thiosulfate/3-mercaptopyruvate sulfurtransferase